MNAKKVWEPKPEDYRQVLEDQNPWRSKNEVPSALAYEVERPLAKVLWKRLLTNSPNRFQLILGPRRVGKSTLMYQTVRHLLNAGVPSSKLWWLRLDHPLLMEVPLHDLARVVVELSRATAQEPAYLFLDEITYAQDWDLWLKTFYDERWPIRIVGTSSATAALRNGRLESGIGRWEEQYLTPYLFGEFLDLHGHSTEIAPQDSLLRTIESVVQNSPVAPALANSMRQFLLVGGFPELLLPLKSQKGTDDSSLLLRSQQILRNDAVERAIYKDIPQAFGLHNPFVLERLLYTLAAQVTGVLSTIKLCQTLETLTQPTCDNYISYLERAFLIFRLMNYSGSDGATQRRGRKVYFVDGAVRNAALQRGLAPLEDQREMGVLWENVVAGHLHALSQLSQIRLYHWRDGNDEVDLIFDHPKEPVAFEIASSGRHGMKGFGKFVSRFPRFRGKCFLVAPAITPSAPNSNQDGVGRIPISSLLLAISKQGERELAKRLGAP